MKVGFADGCLGAPHNIAPLSTPTDPVAAKLDEILERMELVAIRGLKGQVKLEQQLEKLTVSVSERLPDSTSEVKQFKEGSD